MANSCIAGRTEKGGRMNKLSQLQITKEAKEHVVRHCRKNGLFIASFVSDFLLTNLK